MQVVAGLRYRYYLNLANGRCAVVPVYLDLNLNGKVEEVCVSETVCPEFLHSCK